MRITGNMAIMVRGGPPERWRQIHGYENVYEVSDRWRVRRIARGHGARPGRILKPWMRKDGYLVVSLHLRGKQTQFYVARLVANAFLPEKGPTDTVVRHLNDDPSDNRPCNLAWGTYSDNTNDAVRNGKWRAPKGTAHGRSKLTDDQVLEIRRMYATGEFTQQELAVRFGVSRRTIGYIVARHHWKHIL